MSSSKVLLFYKKTSYDHYFLAGKKRSSALKKLLAPRDLKRFLDTHQLHYATLAGVEKALRRRGVRYERFCRGKAFDPSGFGLVITVGGDGTFLEAARPEGAIRFRGQLQSVLERGAFLRRYGA